jgi:hypothetical protein
MAAPTDDDSPEEWRPRIATTESFTGRSGRSTYLNQERFDETFQFLPPPTRPQHTHPRAHSLLHSKHLSCCRSPAAFGRFLLSFLPILQWLPRYRWRETLLGDAMAGITVGIVHVPQGIAYAILTGVEPVYGLYTSFFSVLFYMIFG